MLDLNDFFYFVQIVDRSGSTAAGRMLRIPKSTLSHRIERLETEARGSFPAGPSPVRSRLRRPSVSRVAENGAAVDVRSPT